MTARPGFLAVAGSLGQTGAKITQKPFGININGAAIPPAATINPAGGQAQQPDILHEQRAHEGIEQRNRARG